MSVPFSLKETASKFKSAKDCVRYHIDCRFDEIANEAQIAHILPLLLPQNRALAQLVSRGATTSKDYQKIIEAVFTYWVSPACRIDAIQSWTAYSSEVTAALQEVMQTAGRGKTIGIFTSGGTIATIMAYVLQLSHDQIYKFYEPVINCAISQLFFAKDRISLSSFNDHACLVAKSAELGEGLITYR